MATPENSLKNDSAGVSFFAEGQSSSNCVRRARALCNQRWSAPPESPGDSPRGFQALRRIFVRTERC